MSQKMMTKGLELLINPNSYRVVVYPFKIKRKVEALTELQKLKKGAKDVQREPRC